MTLSADEIREWKAQAEECISVPRIRTHTRELTDARDRRIIALADDLLNFLVPSS